MLQAHRIFSFTAVALLLLGAGCGTAMPAIPDLPTTPPAPAMMDDMHADDAMMPNDHSDDAMMPGDGGMMDGEPQPEGDQAMMQKEDPASYIAYSEQEYNAARAKNRPVALYFWAAWCPICRAEEPGVKETIETSGLPVSGFRVNYDTEMALKARYGIPYQHTMVILDRQGNESARFTGPVSPETLVAALAVAAK